MSKPRTPGRPAGDNAVDHRARLLDAAVACYARDGVAAASNRAIASAAGVNPALVHYYFGDRIRLRDAVVAERLMPAIEAMAGAVGEPAGDVLGLATRFVDAAVETIDRHPWLPALWVREVLCEGGALRDVVFERIGPVPRTLVARFAQAQAEGRLNPGLDPRLLMVSLVGLTMFPAASAPIRRGLLGVDDLGGEAIRRHAVALLAHGLAVPRGDAG